MTKITDEYVQARETLTAAEAAAYLGISWWTLTDKLQKGEYSFGTARLGNGGRWTYTIWAKRVYQFKHGQDTDLRTELRVLTQEVAKLNERLQTVTALLNAAG